MLMLVKACFPHLPSLILTSFWSLSLQVSSFPGWMQRVLFPAHLGPFSLSVEASNTHPEALSCFQFSSVTQSCPTLWPHGLQHSRPPCPLPAPRVYPNHVHRVGDAIQPSHPLLSSLLLPSICPSIRVFSNESAPCIRWPKYWSYSFSISPSNEYSGLIFFRMDWLDLLAVQGTLKSLLQHHSLKVSILRCSAFFIVQLSHPYMTTGKTIALTRRAFVDKVMPLLFNMLSRLVIAFLPRRKRLLVSWLQPSSVVILKPKKVKSLTVSILNIYLQTILNIYLDTDFLIPKKCKLCKP